MATVEPAYLVGAATTQPGATSESKQMGGPKSKEADTQKQQRPAGGNFESVSLSGSRSDQSENVNSSASPSLSSHNSNEEYEAEEEEAPHQQQEVAVVKCSAVHTLERNMPDYDYSEQVAELRAMILEHGRENQGLYSQQDLEKCRQDDWYLSRFLLRQNMNTLEAYEMLKRAMRFNQESLANHLKPEDFPEEFYQVGGLVPYGQDRKGNKMMYMRVCRHQKTPEIASIIQAFIYYNIKQLDELAQGRGISMVIDCQGGGLANADTDTLLFIISTLKNYFPKGLSYFLVHELPWILKPIWLLAKAWVPEEHRQLIKFSDSRNIHEFIEPAQLPDFIGGQVGEAQYKRLPAGCTHLEEAVKLWGIDRPTLRRVLDKFRADLPDETLARIEDYLAEADQEEKWRE